MNQTELTNRIAADVDLPSRAVDAVLQGLARQVQAAMAKGDRVQVSGLFIAEAVQRVERPGRNPRTGETITIPAHRAVRLTPAAGLKQSVAD